MRSVSGSKWSTNVLCKHIIAFVSCAFWYSNPNWILSCCFLGKHTLGCYYTVWSQELTFRRFSVLQCLEGSSWTQIRWPNTSIHWTKKFRLDSRLHGLSVTFMKVMEVFLWLYYSQLDVFKLWRTGYLPKCQIL